MTNTARFRPDEVEPIIDPTTGSGDVLVFPDGFGQQGKPFVMQVADPPNKTRPAHHHHGDVIYFYIQGEHHIEGEGTYRTGDVRWARAGHVYGPETTGPEGGTWWLVSYADPIPVQANDGQPAVDTPPADRSNGPARFRPPFDWPAIDAEVRTSGAAVAEALVANELVARTNADFDAWLAEHPDAGLPTSGSELYDLFLGHRTVRLHGLAAKVPAAAELIGHEDVVGWAERLLAPLSNGIQLNAGELIQIGPGEPAQYLHRDSDSWPMPVGEHPVLVNAMVALSDFTSETGATNAVLGSQTWPDGQHPSPDQIAQVTMAPGDVLLFRGDIVHGGGHNRTTDKGPPVNKARDVV